MLEGLFQPMHLLVIAFIAVLVFGPKRLPEIGKSIGEGIKGFKNSMHDEPQAEAKQPEVKQASEPPSLTSGDPPALN